MGLLRIGNGQKGRGEVKAGRKETRQSATYARTPWPKLCEKTNDASDSGVKFGPSSNYRCKCEGKNMSICS